ncbi:MAG TPA: crosslink repair DNA glycosylase YcaQ family protein [Polyangiaceae bacterium]|nr:crosslink repair DNA glycosylase YcaQ family protein [Polyangiaceae bacterium]
MTPDLLIDSIVRQTTVLLAQLATSTGGRARLANTASQVFLDLIRELKEQGLNNKLIADMFGLTLRTYHNRVRRLAESSTFEGRSLWEAVLSFLQERGTARRGEVLRRFSRDDERMVRAVLSDLTDSGIVYRSGRGDLATYRVATETELDAMDDAPKNEGFSHLVVAVVSRFGPLTSSEIAEHVRLPQEKLEGVVRELVEGGRLQRQGSGNRATYSAERCFISFGEPAGWEAAVFDHFQAMVTAICLKLRTGELHASLSDAIGGSTYTFDLWEGHPMQQEVLALLAALRRQGRELRERVEAFNQDHERPTSAPELRVITYVGQGVIGAEKAEGEDGW